MKNIISYFEKEKGWYWLKDDHLDILDDTRNVSIVTDDHDIIDEDLDIDPETGKDFWRPLKISDIITKNSEGYIISIVNNGDTIKKIILKKGD